MRGLTHMIPQLQPYLSNPKVLNSLKVGLQQ